MNVGKLKLNRVREIKKCKNDKLLQRNEGIPIIITEGTSKVLSTIAEVIVMRDAKSQM